MKHYYANEFIIRFGNQESYLKEMELLIALIDPRTDSSAVITSIMQQIIRLPKAFDF